METVEFVLAIIKILACTGFIIFGIIVNVGGIPGDPRGYIGAAYWHDPYSAFKNGETKARGLSVWANIVQVSMVSVPSSP